jgi:predicted enzyme related to lactoylglutathione lyase
VAIARSPVLAVDCPDPAALATFYAAMLGWEIESVTDDRAAVRGDRGQYLSFHRVAPYVAPTWPSQEKPQQMHLDVLVDDLDTAEVAVLDLGATKPEHQPGASFRVFLDPAGHPFCLCAE